MIIKRIKRIFNTILIASGVVLFWRGAWGLMDLYIVPDNPSASFVISLVLGIGILYFSKHLFDELM